MIEKIQNIKKLINSLFDKLPSLTIGGLKRKYKNDPEVLILIDYISAGLETGMYICICFILFFIVWGGFAPLDSSVVAHGSVVPVGKPKVVQHLHGGIIEKILITEGQEVKKGQPLIELSKTQAKSKLQVLINQMEAKKIAEARINSEMQEIDSFILPEGINLADNDDLKKIWETEKRVLEENIGTLKGQVGIHEQQINIANDQVINYEKQLKSAEKEKALVQEELNNVQVLYKKQLVQKTRLLSLEKASAEVDIKITEFQSNINRTRESINEIRLKIDQIRQSRQRELSQELSDLRQKLASLKEEVDAAQDIETRTLITSPEDGIITDLKFHTEGGVIPQGQPIMEIVPSNAELIVEVRVLPKDIDVIKKGQQTKIMITSFQSRFSPRIDGIVSYVSADKVPDEKTGGYYVARIDIDKESIDKQGKKLVSGMPAEAFIVTGERTFLEYFFSPILYSFRKSMSE